MPRLASRLTSRAVLAAVCALAAHAAAYGTLWPQDGAHGYFGWYEPLVAAVSISSVAGLVLLLVLVVVVRRCGRRPRLAVPPVADRPLGPLTVEIAVSGLAYLIVQESLERSMAQGAPRLGAFAPGQWLVVLAVLGSAALVLAVALRVAGAAVRVALGRPPAPAARRDGFAWSVVVGEARRSRPLAVGRALRAPPLLSQA